MASTVRTERDGRVVVVTLDNPPRNFMNGRMVRELEAVVRELEDDDSVGAVVLTGAHPESFLTHYDVAEIAAGAESTPMTSAALMGGAQRAVETLSRVPGAGEALGRTPAAGMVELRRIHELFLRMNRMDQVFVAAINGIATGGGCELALACDIRYAASTARLGQPEVNLGIIPGWGGTQRLARVCGLGIAKDLIFTGRLVSADEALRIGLVNDVHDPVLEKARETGALLASKSPVALRSMKELANRALGGNHDDNLAAEGETFAELFATADAREGLTAFVEKREPVFRGS